MTSIDTGPTWIERLNPRNWTLTWKLIVVGLVPALLALSLGVLRVADQAGTAAELGRSSRLLEVREQVADAADALRLERDEATLYVAGNRSGDRGVLDIGFGQTDGEVGEMRSAVTSATELDPTTAATVAQAVASVDQLPPLRLLATDNTAVAAVQIRDRYSTAIESLDVLDRTLLRQLRTPATAGLTDALSAVRSVTAELALQHTVLGSAIRAGSLEPADANIVTATDIQLLAQFRAYQVALTPERAGMLGNFLDNPPNVDRQRLKSIILTIRPDRPITVTAEDWNAAYDGSREAAAGTAALISQELVARSAAAEEEARSLAGINSVILMLGLLIGITIAVVVARSLIRSLRVLRTAALDVAERRLPQAVESMRAGETPDISVDPVPLNTRDEVGQVARAFDAVHGQAVRLAADQAALQSNVSAMFVNLSRRSQALVERQLQLIEQLESNEQDADQLANLFQLDHLATRMRRNSENLLVLAGTDLAKRNIAPVPMVDVLRAAVSEVEQYRRIVVQAPPTATILGRAASDLVHLLAELLDNATNFSPPESQVVMSTTLTNDGSIVVEIADRGVGMIDHELDDANQRLGGPSSVDVSASRRMGLFVVGRLGARHGIGVRLTSTGIGAGSGGLTASVAVPAYLVPSSEPAESGRPIGVPGRTGVPMQGGGSLGVPPQRGALNGNGRSGSLSALVAGTDGSGNPAGSPPVGGIDGVQFGGPPINGTPAGLPTRHPGSSLRPDDPSLPPARPDSSGGASDDGRAAEQRAREVAEQARRDQEAAAARAAKERGERTRPGIDDLYDTGRNGTSRNGAPPEQPLFPPPTGATAYGAGQGPPDARPPAPGQPRPPRPGADAAEGGHSERPRPLPERRAPQAFRFPEPFAADDGDFGTGAPERVEPPSDSRPSGTPQVPPAPSTAPMPLVGRSDVMPPRPHPGAEERPAEEPNSANRPFADGPREEYPQDRNPERPQHGPVAPRPLPQRTPQPAPVPAAPTPTDELFAASVPAAADLDGTTVDGTTVDGTALDGTALDATTPSDPSGDGAGQPSGFELGETTPIFEEIASAWFRSNRPVPVTWDTDEDGQEQPAGAGTTEPDRSAGPDAAAYRPTPGQGELATAHPAPSTARRGPSARPLPSAQPLPAAQSTPAARTSPSAPEAAPRPDMPTPLPVRRPAPVREHQPAAEAGRGAEPTRVPTAAPTLDHEFASAADEGWRVARGVASERPDEMTSAGLPKRRPRARLVPGSAGSAVLAPPVSASRSAETIRGRLASYQQGVRQGRESRFRSDTDDSGTTPAPAAGGHHDEESS